MFYFVIFYRIYPKYSDGRGGGIQLMTVWYFVAQGLSLLPSQYDLNNVLRDVKHQIIIIWTDRPEQIYPDQIRQIAAWIYTECHLSRIFSTRLSC